MFTGTVYNPMPAQSKPSHLWSPRLVDFSPTGKNFTYKFRPEMRLPWTDHGRNGKASVRIMATHQQLHGWNPRKTGDQGVSGFTVQILLEFLSTKSA
jgi:hypothetical protein